MLAAAQPVAARWRAWAPSVQHVPTEYRWTVPLIAAGILALLTLSPVAAVLVGSFRPTGLPASAGWTLQHYVRIWSDAYTYRALVQTAVFAVSAGLFAECSALLLAWLLERTDVPWASYFRAGIMVAMVTPPILFAIGWVLLGSPKIGLLRATGLDIYGLPGMIAVQGLAMTPTSFLLLSPVIRFLNPALEEAATVSGASTWQLVRRITLPLLLPALISVGTLAIIFSTLALDIPLIIGLPARIPLLSLHVYDLMQPTGGPPSYGQVAAVNNVVFVILGVAMFIYYRATREAARFATVTGKGYRPNRVRLGKWRWLGFAAVGSYFLAALGLPFLALLWVSVVPYYSGFDPTMFERMTGKNFLFVFGQPAVHQAAVNSAVVAIVAALGACLLSVLVAWVVIRSRVSWRRLLDVLAMLPIGTSAVMMGIALVFIFFGFRAIPIYGTIWVIAIGHAIVYLPFSARTVQAAMLQLSRELEEAAQVAGATMRGTLRRVVVPLLTPALVGVLVWVAFHSLREFSIAVMLQSGNNKVLSTVLFGYWNSGQAQYATAIAVSLMVLLGILVLLAGRLMSRRAETEPPKTAEAGLIPS
jgi:iron(III) transport system permease protein